MNAITAETLSALSADLTSAVKDIRAARLAFRASIKAIREAGDWTATEHKSWTTFAASVISEALPKSAAAIDWTIVAVACAEEGMSVRAIAPIVGKSPAGVSKAVRKAIAEGDAEVPEVSTGADGQQRQTARAARSTGAKAKGKGETGKTSGAMTLKVSEVIKATGAVRAAVIEAKNIRPRLAKASHDERATAAKNLRESIAQAQALLQAIEQAEAKATQAEAAKAPKAA